MRISVRISDVCSSDLGDCPVGRTEDQAVGRFLATIEFDAVIDGSDGLDPCACLIASEKGGHGVPPGFARGEHAMPARERITRGQPALVLTCPWNEFARTDHRAYPSPNVHNGCRQDRTRVGEGKSWSARG